MFGSFKKRCRKVLSSVGITAIGITPHVITCEIITKDMLSILN